MSDFDDPSDEQFPSADTLARIPWPSRRPTLIDIAWIAGLYEGEGSASRGTITIPQKEREVLDRVQELVGGRVSGPHYRVEPSGEPTYQHKWWATGRRGRGIAMTMYFLLSARRRAQLEEFVIDVSRETERPEELTPENPTRYLVDFQDLPPGILP